jgi:hypothetical protein
LIVFVFCTISSSFAINTQSNSKQITGDQVDQHLPFDYTNNLPLYAELEEEAFSDLDFVGSCFVNIYNSIQQDKNGSSRFIFQSGFNYHHHSPIFITIRSIRI